MKKNSIVIPQSRFKNFDDVKSLGKNIRLAGINGLFIPERVDKNTIPEGLHRYEAASDNEPNVISRVNKKVMVHFSGTFVLDKPLNLDDQGVFWVDEGDLLFL